MTMQSRHGTLVANTVATVALSVANTPGENQESFERCVVFARGTGDVFVRTDGVNPTVGGNDTFVVPANTRREIHLSGTSADIRLISSGTPGYTVETYSR